MNNQPVRRFGALSSSEDPQKLAATVSGVLKALGGLAAFWGLSQVAGDLNLFAQQVAQLITLGYAFFGVAETAFGIARKVVIGVQQYFASKSAASN